MFSFIKGIILLLLFQFTLPYFSFAQGSENALQFDGTDDFVLSSRDNRNITDQVTVTAWVKTSSKKLQMVMTKYDRDAEHGYQLVMSDGRAAFTGRDGSGKYCHSGYSPITIADNKWHHLAGVVRNGVWTIYIDGTMQSNYNSFYNYTDLRSTAPLTIGNYYLVNFDFFEGTIDEVRIWNKALTEYEIIENMCQKITPSSPNLVGYFKFDEKTGTTLSDYSPLKLDGILTNMNPSAARKLSGAPIGDKSVYVAAWRNDGQKLSFKGAGDVTFSIDSVEAYGKIVHLYYVYDKPNTTNGIADPNQVNEYFGVFTSRTPGLKHKVSFNLGNQAICKANIFTREDNAIQQWDQVQTVGKNNLYSAISTTGRGEYILNSTNGGAFPLNLPTEFYACSGDKVSIDASLDGATYRWSNGKTTAAIEVTSPAIVSLDITYKGCTTSQSFSVLDDECITIPNIITPNGDNKNDSFVIKGANPADLEVEIFNRWGVSLYKRTGYDGNWSAQNMAAGTYYYVVKSNRSNRTFKGWVEVVF